MAKTPDRFPGESIEDQFYELTEHDTPPTALAGTISYVNGSFYLVDSSGNFDPRSGGGGITPSEHRILDQLVHGLAEDYYEEYTYSGSRVTNCTTWETAAKLKKIREEQYSYTGSRVTGAVTIQYDAAGSEVERLTETYSYTGSRVGSVTAVRSVP